jgi:hypothetical protein
MKPSLKELFYDMILLLLVFLASCKNKEPSVGQRVIAMKDLKRAALNSSQPYISLQILKTYPVQMECTLNVRYANLYICKKRLTKPDTLYIFDECGKVPDFAIDTSINIEVGFYIRDTLKNFPKQVIVFVPKQFRLSKNAKYVFGKLTGTMF